MPVSQLSGGPWRPPPALRMPPCRPQGHPSPQVQQRAFLSPTPPGPTHQRPQRGPHPKPQTCDWFFSGEGRGSADVKKDCEIGRGDPRCNHMNLQSRERDFGEKGVKTGQGGASLAVDSPCPRPGAALRSGTPASCPASPLLTLWSRPLQEFPSPSSRPLGEGCPRHPLDIKPS